MTNEAAIMNGSEMEVKYQGERRGQHADHSASQHHPCNADRCVASMQCSVDRGTITIVDRAGHRLTNRLLVPKDSRRP